MGLHHDALENIFSQAFSPALEQLQHLGAAVCLHHQVAGRRLDEDFEDLVQALGLGIGEGAGPGPIRAPPLNHVGRHGPGGAGKADQGAFRLKGRPHPGQGLSNGAEATGRGLDLAGQGGDLGKWAKPWPLARLEPDFLAQGLGDEQDVRKDDGGVEGKPPHGLERRLGGHFRIVAEGQEVLRPGPELPVLRQRASGLAHEPDWRALEGLAGQGPEEFGSGGLSHGALKPRPAARLKGRGPSPVSYFHITGFLFQAEEEVGRPQTGENGPPEAVLPQVSTMPRTGTGRRFADL